MGGPSSESGTTDDLDWFRMQFRRKNVLRFLGKKIDFGMILRANLFKNQADLHWRVIYDPLGFA